jgi:hypothetical protein
MFLDARLRGHDIGGASDSVVIPAKAGIQAGLCPRPARNKTQHIVLNGYTVMHDYDKQGQQIGKEHETLEARQPEDIFPFRMIDRRLSVLYRKILVEAFWIEDIMTLARCGKVLPYQRPRRQSPLPC